MIELSGCAIIENKKLLLLWKKKHAHFEFPGGKVESNETIEAAAMREVREELGVEVDMGEYIGCKEFTIDGKRYRSHKFIACIKSGVPKIMEPDKFDRIEWIPIADYEKYALAPNARAFCRDVVDGKLSVD